MPVDSFVQGTVLAGSALAVFSLACMLHVVVWRLAAATPSGLTLIVLLTGAVVALCAAMTFVMPGPDLAVVAALALQFAACYVISYPAMQAHSPSLEIAQHLAVAGPDGITRAELYARLSEASLVRERVDDLVRDGLASERGGRFRCTARGGLLARFFAGWKALLREPKGG